MGEKKAAKSRAAKTAGSLFDEIDTDKNGNLTKDELVQAMPTYFQMSFDKANEVCLHEHFTSTGNLRLILSSLICSPMNVIAMGQIGHG